MMRLLPPRPQGTLEEGEEEEDHLQKGREQGQPPLSVVVHLSFGDRRRGLLIIIRVRWRLCITMIIFLNLIVLWL